MSSIDSEKKCTYGRRLKEERERIELSQEEFGHQLDTTKRTVVNWEAGHSAPDMFDLAIMGMSLGMDTNYIIHGQRTPAGIAQGTAAYSPADLAAAEIRSLKLTTIDSELIIALARRLAVY